MSEDLNMLLTPFNIGKIQIKNRFCMGPMGGAYSLFGGYHEWNDRAIEYYTERAKGGFGLIFTGVMSPDMKVENFNPTQSQSPLYSPLHFRDAAARLADRCRAYDTKLFGQLTMGAGRNYPGQLAPSSVECYKYTQYKSIEITKEQIQGKVQQIAAAAGLLKSAGFAGVDIHALHWGYMLDQFAMSITNHREDEYGGSLENRLRLCKELLDAVKGACGPDFPVTIRLSLKSYIKALNKASLHGEEEAGRTLEEGLQICRMLEEMGYDALSVDTGMYDSFYYACPPIYMPKGHALNLYEQAKKAVNIPILAGSRMGDPHVCAEALRKGQADAFVLARPALADPYLPRKIEMGKAEKIRPCIGCNMGCVGRLLDQNLTQTCAVNPRALREIDTKPHKSAEPKKIMIIGGGVAGMEAACTATRCGHDVRLYEKDSQLGGELIAAGVHDFKPEIKELNAWYQGELADLEVPVYLNTEVTPEMVRAEKPDVVILAVGASPVMPKSIPGIDSAKAISGVDALLGKRELGEKLVIVGGGQVGCETAVDFAQKGKQVVLVEALPDILSAEFVPTQQKMMLGDMLEDLKVDIRRGYKLVAITAEGAVVEPAAGGEQEVIEGDDVVLSIGLKPNPSMAAELRGCGAAVYEIGSGKKNGNVMNAVHEAFEVTYNL